MQRVLPNPTNSGRAGCSELASGRVLAPPHPRRGFNSNATPEMAIALLEDLQAGFHKMAHNPELLEKLYRELRKKKPNPRIS